MIELWTVSSGGAESAQFCLGEKQVVRNGLTQKGCARALLSLSMISPFTLNPFLTSSSFNQPMPPISFQVHSFLSAVLKSRELYKPVLFKFI